LCGVILLMSLVTACSGDEGSDSTATSTTEVPRADWITPDGKEPAAANRPSELTVDDVRPCDLLTDDQRGELRLTGEQTSEYSSTWGADTCKILGADALSASLTAVSSDGIDALYLGRFANLQYRPTEVRGFPAIFYRFDNADHACYLAVDVADGQLVDLAFGAGDPDSTTASQDELCDTAHQVVEAAVNTLLADR
jgi:hypothetical protein